jgi:nucleoside-diphosphate-sugar epimerase|tara:strand:- start:2883 stop:3812 length:930 start_codon:yes stop_codon:yes gene_type:complete
MKIILTGGAGLVGQNLIVHLKARGYTNLVILDKHRENLEIAKQISPDLVCEYADLAESGEWQNHFEGAGCCVMLQAQIGAKTEEPFIRNNITSTQLLIATIKKYAVPYSIQISSSVVESVADDYYTNTKKHQEKLFLDSGLEGVVLRPTLMFGWFDRKHLGWLSRFMRKVPVFPIPGHGRYMRQPLYAKDFANIIMSCIENKPAGSVYNITGLEKIDYIDMIKTIKQTVKAKAFVLKIPFALFFVLLKIWALFDKNPPFTADQLSALVADDEFEVIDWEAIFGVTATPFTKAVEETFTHPDHGSIELAF